MKEGLSRMGREGRMGTEEEEGGLRRRKEDGGGGGQAAQEVPRLHNLVGWLPGGLLTQFD